MLQPQLDLITSENNLFKTWIKNWKNMKVRNIHSRTNILSKKDIVYYNPLCKNFRLIFLSIDY